MCVTRVTCTGELFVSSINGNSIMVLETVICICYFLFLGKLLSRKELSRKNLGIDDS